MICAVNDRIIAFAADYRDFYSAVGDGVIAVARRDRDIRRRAVDDLIITGTAED